MSPGDRLPHSQHRSKLQHQERIMAHPRSVCCCSCWAEHGVPCHCVSSLCVGSASLLSTLSPCCNSSLGIRGLLNTSENKNGFPKLKINWGLEIRETSPKLLAESQIFLLLLERFSDRILLRETGIPWQGETGGAALRTCTSCWYEKQE